MTIIIFTVHGPHFVQIKCSDRDARSTEEANIAELWAQMLPAAKKLPPEECPRHMENSIDPVIKGAAVSKKKKEDDGWFVTICQYGNKASSPAPLM